MLDRATKEAMMNDAHCKAARRVLRAGDNWGEVRCQTCYGIGTVTATVAYRDLGEGVYNAEDVDLIRCPACEGYGVPVSTLMAVRV